MIATLALTCALLAGHNPAPDLQWTHASPETVDGFRVYLADPTGSWTLAADFPCWVDSVNENWTCRPWATPQKFVTSAREVEYQFYVTAYNSAGESGPSNVVSLCWPVLWTFNDRGSWAIN